MDLQMREWKSRGRTFAEPQQSQKWQVQTHFQIEEGDFRIFATGGQDRSSRLPWTGMLSL